MPRPYEADWRSRVASPPFRGAVSFDDDTLVLGSGTVLYKLAPIALSEFSLRPDAAHDRMVALLAVAGRGRVEKPTLAQLDAALDDWRRGERGLAAIRLAFAPLPRLRDQDEAYSLFLAEIALDAGLSPNDLLKTLGYADCAPLLKFDPSQPRVPAGSGPPSGQWTSDGGAGGAASSAPGAAAKPVPTFKPVTNVKPTPTIKPVPTIKPTPAATESIGLIPIFFQPKPDGEDEVSQDKERRFGIGETEEERIEEGREFRFPMPGGIGSSTPRSSDPSVPAAPDRGAAPLPHLSPSPGGGGPPSSTPLGDEEPDDNGVACPEQQNDRPLSHLDGGITYGKGSRGWVAASDLACCSGERPQPA